MPVFLHQHPVHVFTSGERYGRASQEHEPVKQRQIGEENSFSNIGIVRSLRRFFDWWRAKPEAQLNAGAMNSKELTEGN